MKVEIINNLDNPKQLEKLYQENKTIFKREFNLLYPDFQENTTAQIWNERFNYDKEDISWGSSNELIFVIIISIIAGLIAKIPELTGINTEFFFQRNLSYIVFPVLIAYFSWRQKLQIKKIVISIFAILFSVIYINLLPKNSESNTLALACIHLPLFLWAVLGFSFVGNANNIYKRLDFLRYNGDLAIMTTIILIAGAIMTGITLGLFSLIKLEIHEFYFKYVVVWGLAASPIIGTYLVQTNPQLVSKVSPIIAKVFTPLVLVTLIIYLFAIVGSGKDPYNDREFLFIFNMLLIGVMAIIFFSIVETSKSSNNEIGTILLFSISLITIVINGIALSAIIFRIYEWGITPNRLAVLGGNILILTNLCNVTYRLFKMIGDKNGIKNVEKSIATFLPIYSIWTIIVTFVFPILFKFK